MQFTIIYIIAIFAIFYFLLIRPQQKKTKQLKEMRDGLAVGDTVITIGGLSGKVAKITDDEVILSVGEVSLTFKKWAIGSVLGKESA